KIEALSVAVAQFTRLAAASPAASVALLISTLPLALNVNPSTPTRLAPAKLISSPVYPVLSVGLVIPAGRTRASFTLPPVTLKPTAPAVLTESSVTSLKVPFSSNVPPVPANKFRLVSVTVVTPALVNTPLAPIAVFFVSTVLVPCVIVKLAVPTTNPNAFKLTLPPTCKATSLVSSLLKVVGKIDALSVAVAQFTRLAAASPAASVALLISTLPLALNVNPSTPTRLAPAKLISSPVYPVLSVGLVIPAGRTRASFTLPPVTLKPTAPAVLTESSVTSLKVPFSSNAPPVPANRFRLVSVTVVTPALVNTPLVPIAVFFVSTVLVPCVIVKLAVPTTNPNAFKLT